MSNNKQSSVEWYANEEDKLFTSYQKGLMSTSKYILFKYKLREQAKQMHKEEIINATIYGDKFEGCYGLDSEQHYNETFGGNNE